MGSLTAALSLKGEDGMIEWKKYETGSLPDIGTEYLVTNGKIVKIAKLYVYFNCTLGWESGHADCPEDITHYAEVNLPKEEG